MRALQVIALGVTAMIAVPAVAQQQELRAVVVLARHGVRAPVESETRGGVFNAQPWPAWPAPTGLLTPHGIDALKRMGEYYKARYGAVMTGCSSVAVESTNVPRTIASAHAVMEVVAPACTPEVKTDLTTDPKGMDQARFHDAVMGRMGAQPEWFTQSYARPLATMHAVLAACKGCRSVPDFRTMMLTTDNASATPAMMQSAATAKTDAAKTTVVPRDAAKENAVALGADFAENILLEYVEGMPMREVGWGRVDRAQLDELMEMNTRYHDFMLRTPYWAAEAAGPLAKKIAALLTAASNDDAAARFVYLSAHDANIGWLAGVLRVDWAVRDEAMNATPPGSAMIFELWRDTATKQDSIRVSFVAQTLDQIRTLAPLTTGEGPSVAPIYIPGCSSAVADSSGTAREYACSVKAFAEVVERDIAVESR